LPAFAIPALGLAYQLHGGIDYIHVEALEALLGMDGVLLLLTAFSPHSNDSLFGRVRSNGGRDLETITLLLFLSALLMINGLLDLAPARDGVGLTAGYGIAPGQGVTTLLGILFLPAAMIALFLLLVEESLGRAPHTEGHRGQVASSPGAAEEPVRPLELVIGAPGLRVRQRRVAQSSALVKELPIRFYPG
jgi:hypothetical protein